MARKTALFMGDVFRTHTMLKGGRYGESTTKLARLMRSAVARCGYDVMVVEDSNSDEISGLYEALFGTSNNVHTWAFRSQVLCDRVATFYEYVLENVTVVIGFEVPESLFAFCTRNGIPVLDFSFHFVRFQDDYSFMVRTNDDGFETRLKTLKDSHNVLDALSRVSGLERPELTGQKDGIGLFLIQTRYDRSKFSGQGTIADDLELAKKIGDKIDFYKAHPMEHRPEVEIYLNDIGAKPFPADLDIYNFLVQYGYMTSLYTVSSGLAAEGDMIGVRGATYLKGFPWVVDGFEQYSSQDPFMAGTYIPVTHDVLSQSFISAMLEQRPCPDPVNTPTSFCLKEYWNVRWS